VPLEQPAGILIPLLLEPQSTRGILTEGSALQYHFGQYLVEGEEYPIHRLRHSNEGGNDTQVEREDLE
jgi:hypothetical protein